MMDDLTALSEMLDEGLVVRDNKDHEVLAIGLLATVYFAEPWKRSVREIAARFTEDYIQRWAPHLRWALNPETHRMERLPEAQGARPTSFEVLEDEDSALSAMAYGAAYNHGASAAHVEAFAGSHLRDDELGFLRFGCPLVPPPDVSFNLPEALLELCRALRPLSGYAGIGVVQSPDSVDAQRWEQAVYELAQRFPGLEAEFSICHSNWLVMGRDGKDGIKGVNWLTVVADRYLDELGGAAAVQAAIQALDECFIVHRYEGGVLIQAGDRPALGDVEREAWPELYVKLARYLKPIRITQHRPFGHGGNGWAFGKAEAEAWLRRFDDR